jgi:hypothetical protein
MHYRYTAVGVSHEKPDKFSDDLGCNRGYKWWLLEQARARNPNIKTYALSWAVPYWVCLHGANIQEYVCLGFLSSPVRWATRPDTTARSAPCQCRGRLTGAGQHRLPCEVAAVCTRQPHHWEHRLHWQLVRRCALCSERRTDSLPGMSARGARRRGPLRSSRPWTRRVSTTRRSLFQTVVSRLETR